MSFPSDLAFLPGLDLSERFFVELIQPLLKQHYPSLQYVACRLGPGSDVLGFDTEQSRDHDWGPKCDLFLENDTLKSELNEFFHQHLQGRSIAGYSTEFRRFEEFDGHITLINVSPEEKGTCHGIRLMTMQQFFLDYLQWSIDEGNEPTWQDWLTFPIQHLVTIRRGRVFHATDRMPIEQIRSRLAFYPDDVWFYLLGSLWQRIGQEEHLMGRAGQVGDELGSTLIANRLVRDLMRLIFLVEKEYYPYAKWFGQAFRQWTHSSHEIESILRQVQLADQWTIRETWLSQAYQYVARLFNEKFFDQTSKIDVQVTQFHHRPFQVIHAGLIAEKIFARIENIQLRQMPKIGSVDLFIDSTDALDIQLRDRMKRIFE